MFLAQDNRLSPHVRALLLSLAWAERDLEKAPNIHVENDARAQIKALKHSLWLAGYSPERED